jgi:hypothetical protein
VATLGFSVLGYASTKTITIKGSNSDSGDVIEVDDSAQVSITSDSTGVVLTLPSLDVRLRCLGDATVDGYCYIAASSGGGGSSTDSDGDNVPDGVDTCPNTNPNSNPINNSGCPDTDGDGYFDNSDSCPNEGGDVTSNGCLPAGSATYRVTPSAGNGGTLSPSIVQTVDAGGTATFTVAANEGYSVSSVTGCGGSLSAGTNYTTGPVNADCTVTASFSADSSDSASYCANKPSNVDCSRSRNLDVWWEAEGYFEVISVPRGRILSLPFTIRDSTTDRGAVSLNSFTDLGTSGAKFNLWFSTTPGGTPLNGQACQKSGNIAQGQFGWQSQTGSRFYCGLGTSSGVRYLNFQVTDYNASYPFELNTSLL